MAREFTFKLKSDAKEYDGKRYGGNEVTLTLPETMDAVRALVADGQDADKAILGLITGQGLRLTKQKAVKDFLGSEDAAKMEPAAAIAEARKRAEALKIGAPRVRTGGKKSARVAEAEAKAESATNALRDTYLNVPASVRKTLRADFLAKGIFTEEQLAEMDAEAKK